jgi:hypothetical protein
MSTIPAGTKFHGVATGVDTVNKGSANANANRDAYTIEDLASAINILIENNEIVRLVPLFVTATPGGSATLTEDVNIVDFNWVGGSGTFVYTLPSATAIPYRKIRFVNDSTISASNQIEITAPVGETIDGASSYTINKAFNGCAVWSDGTEWIVIQAKAT